MQYGPYEGQEILYFNNFVQKRCGSLPASYGTDTDVVPAQVKELEHKADHSSNYDFQNAWRSNSTPFTPSWPED